MPKYFKRLRLFQDFIKAYFTNKDWKILTMELVDYGRMFDIVAVKGWDIHKFKPGMTYPTIRIMINVIKTLHTKKVICAKVPLDKKWLYIMMDNPHLDHHDQIP